MMEYHISVMTSYVAVGLGLALVAGLISWGITAVCRLFIKIINSGGR